MVKINRLFLSRLTTESLWVLTGQVVSVVGQLALIKVTTSLVSVSDYGLFTILLVGGLFIERTIMTVQAGIIRYYCEADDQSQISNYWRSSRALLWRASRVALLAGLILVTALLLLGSIQLALDVLLLLPFTIFMGWNTALNGINLAARRRRIHALAQGGEPLLRLVVVALLIAWLGPAVEALLLAYLAASMLVFFYLFRVTSSFLSDQSVICLSQPYPLDIDWKSKIWTFSWPFSLWGVLAWLQQSSDRFSLEYQVGSDSVGLYSVLFQTGFVPMMLLSSMMSNLIIPVIYRRQSQSEGASHVISPSSFSRDKLTLLTVSFLGALTLVAVSVSWVWHSQLMSLVVASSFLRYTSLLPVMVCAGGLTSIGQALSVELMAAKQTKHLLAVNVAYALVAVAANWIGAGLFGVPGVVMAVLFSSLIYVLLLWGTSSALTPAVAS